MAGEAREAPARGPQTAVAVRPRVAAQRAVFRIVCILPLVSRVVPVRPGRCRSGERESAESRTETHLDPTGFGNLAY
ncbi:hypothetical protein GCM10010095_01220 [Streptomyces anthocyanicus]|uniref:Uncharacterized protein n=1 Tax=Streptomyces violaceolatus TaxID=67378 RepID=A0ABN3S4M0_9ACTN|nr:hypothetical protein JCM4020_07500 [Streptomyces coelicolor]BDE37470.1 hypothetical protein SLITK23_07150 [Streptomyces lividans]GGL20140.1 hypothetical protein GCM10010095_01220 [Streptomyces anthocyanicus]GHA25391.1 hypothetical protein GCM10010391_06210 [Streptomyces anthocyanicus]GHB91311.1 hypothetical protein GCM10010348_06920 [Streptomyces anthocyanicus]